MEEMLMYSMLKTKVEKNLRNRIFIDFAESNAECYASVTHSHKATPKSHVGRFS